MKNNPDAEIYPAVLADDLLLHHVADNVEFLSTLPGEEAASVLDRLPTERAIEILDQPEFYAAPEVIELLPPEKAAMLLTGMAADRAADVIRLLDSTARATLLSRLDPETRASIERLMVYPPATAGSIMTTEYVSVPANWTVGQTLDHIRQVERTRETIYAIYVLDAQTKRLVQAVPLRRLISAQPDAPILSAARPYAPITTSPLTDREEVARLFRKYDLLAVPVVDSAGRMLGIVTVDDAIDAILEESTEDVQKFGGVAALEKPYMQIGFFQMIGKRAGWLCALFLSEMLTASAMQHFESELARALVLTLFIPLIMSSGGNSGSQATSLLIRALALHELQLRDWWRVILRELPTGVALGAILGLIGLIRIAVWQKLGLFDYGDHWLLIAFTVAAALVGIVTFGSLSGSMLPFMLQRFGFDPASASAPFVATLVDVTGLVIYFSVAAVILHGTLL
ncbi:MAG TPA: magnesium transporter [Pseudolabrys sp.]|nr:magnesium transporter [Pseudolabrys sp.]